MIKFINVSKAYRSKKGQITKVLNNIDINLGNKGLIFKYASKRLRADEEVARAAINNYKDAIEYISDEALKQKILEEQAQGENE